ncbi:PTS sugar transporter subunit IIC [Halolactibacillus alkaliphilus]|uniref:Ascorbate-specific PTS system EIIA component n=1 Tax=Halolactibacillus alkaliphilus TaxID=442899 RepID=A0A511X271_9BACI|nr:BglG family transcription antiterminator [Halolactibacillus alkaliphilus]GEN57030.1 PTS sugar transporter subunit IIC [Halolactibacillus alkaliphilus]GGN68506.1 PTS sugar transporter subunit IIC [Halolactibacillus alkaliphilus]SFO85708.1 Transcriptional antiterminator [Halolactibacillus alkaliphilus]
MIDNHLLVLFGKLIEMPQFTLTELANLIEIERSEVERQIHQLNNYLRKHNFPLIELNDDHYFVPPDLQEETKFIGQLYKHLQIVFSEQERQQLIYLIAFIRKTELSNFHYQEILQVSKNTVLSDIKKVRDACDVFKIKFSYTRKDGYHLEGTELNKRKMAFDLMTKMIGQTNGKWLLNYVTTYWDETPDIKTVVRLMKQQAKKRNISMVESRMIEIAYLIAFIRIRNRPLKVNLQPYKAHISKEMAVYQYSFDILSQQIGTLNNDSEVYVLSSLLLSIIEGDVQGCDDLYDTTKRVVDTMEALSLVSFQSKDQLITSLYTHLVPAYYRLTFDWPFRNDLTEVIKEENEELFHIVNRALDPLREVVSQPISDDEIAYFVIHFGGQLESQLHEKKQYRALIICPNGISSSLILKTELNQLFPDFSFLQKHSVDDLRLVAKEDYDMIFSTVYVKADKPLYIVKPIMSSLAKNRLAQRVIKDFMIENYMVPNIDDLLKTIRKYATIHDEKKLHRELLHTMISQESEKGDDLPMLTDLLTKNYIQVEKDKAITGWKEAIDRSCQPLLEHKNIGPEYVEAIFKKLETYGAYIDLGQGVAIPHARPEDGVKELGMSLLVLNEPVYLLDDEKHPIQLLVTLAAIDNETHLKALSQLTEILRDKDRLTALKQAKSPEDVLELIQEGGE